MWEIIKRCVSVLTVRERRSLIPLVLMMVFGGLIESVSVGLVIPLIAGIIDSGQLTEGTVGSILRAVFGERDGSSYLALLLVVMAMVFIGKNAFLLWRTYQQNKVAATVRQRVQKRLLHYYLTRPYSFYLDVESGDVLRTLNNDSDQFYQLFSNVLGFFSSLVITVIMATLVLLIHPQITMVLVVVLFAQYVVILRVIRPHMRKLGLVYRSTLGHGNSLVVQMVRGIKSIKIARRESYFEDRYRADLDKAIRSRILEQSISAAPQRLIEAFTVSALLGYLLTLVLAGEDMSGLIPVLSAFVLAASRILPCVGGISSSVSNAHYFESSLTRVKEIDDLLKREEAEAAEKAGASLGAPETFEREISLEHVSFSYPNSNQTVLQDASLTIPRNSSIGIVGASGAGKTTLVDVLLGLLEPDDGSISMDGARVDTSSAAWRSKFAYIPQSVFMLTGTIRNNVTFGTRDGEADDERVWQALEMAQLADYVRSLEHGLDSEVGEAGVKLSGGQVQRLGIARALYDNTPILVLDEATSALDNETEEALMQSITSIQGKKTLIIIAHRLTTIENCDRVYRVEGGTVCEDTAR